MQTQLNSDMLDERHIAIMPGPKGRFYRRLPAGVAQALEALHDETSATLSSRGGTFRYPL